MKKRILRGAAIICIMVNYGSCYKTGEVIPQVTCKPTRLYYEWPYEHNVAYTVNFATGNASGEFFDLFFTYDNNRRLNSALAVGYPQYAPDHGSFSDIFKFNFSYDGKQNMIRIDEYDTSIANLHYPVVYITYTYPPNTTGSISSTLQTQRFYLANILQTVQGGTPVYIPQHVLTDNFNTEFQLVSVYDGGTRLEALNYDYGGNMLSDTVYAGVPTPFAQIYHYGYDNEIDPGRSDRTIQLFTNLYSKNNALALETDLYDPLQGSWIFFRQYGDPSDPYNYIYNAQGYPTTFFHKVYGDYACLVAPGPPVINPGPGAAGN
jgi:hypothetical protein